MNIFKATKYLGVGVLVLSLALIQPVTVLAATNAVGGTTGAPPCTGAGCNQGFGQGMNNGGPTLEDLGGYVDENGNDVLPEGVVDTRQGAGQGGLNAVNSYTGAQSKNEIVAEAENAKQTSVANDAVDVVDLGIAGNTGGNSASKNSGSTATKTGNANIGVTQVHNDNATAIGGEIGLQVNGHEGNVDDLYLGFGSGTAKLAGSGQDAKSIQAVNEGTGYDSDNSIILATKTKELNEVQNDGLIENVLDLQAVTGQNDASMNTGDANIATGDANVSATLVNLMNTSVVNGNVYVTVEDVFGDVAGDIVLPDWNQLAGLLSGTANTSYQVEAGNEETGADSKNEIDVDIKEKEKTEIVNLADVDTTVNADAITGQNDASMNTGGGAVDTGDASVQASNVTLANTTVEGGNWMLVVVNAANKFIGYLLGDNGEKHQLAQEETIEALNKQTGANSNNIIDVDVEKERLTDINNDAKIINDVTAKAITGQNTSTLNTGGALIETGDAKVQASAVNLANTTVKDGNLAIAVINVMGDWMGGLMQAGKSLFGGGSDSGLALDANNSQTGADSDNSIDVSLEREKKTLVDNTANVDTVLNANVDTGNNKANSNTNGADISTGDGTLALHTRTVANITGIADSTGIGLEVKSDNDTTGSASKNVINAEVNDERVITVDNEASVSTEYSGGVNTGGNQLSKNTVAGIITTGDIDGNASVDAMLNRVVLALGRDMVDVEGDLRNILTGYDSRNENDVALTRELLGDIFNDATVDTIIDLLLNTGENEASYNTASSELARGGGLASAGDTVGKATAVRPLVSSGAKKDENSEVVKSDDEDKEREEEQGDTHDDEFVVGSSTGGGVISDRGSARSGNTVARPYRRVAGAREVRAATDADSQELEDGSHLALAAPEDVVLGTSFFADTSGNSPASSGFSISEIIASLLAVGAIVGGAGVLRSRSLR